MLHYGRHLGELLNRYGIHIADSAGIGIGSKDNNNMVYIDSIWDIFKIDYNIGSTLPTQ